MLTGTFTVTVTASNSISGKTETRTIAVYERIHDLHIYGDSQVVLPPGSGTWGLAAGPDQFPLDDIECVWNMGANLADTTYNVTLLDSATPHEVTFSYGTTSALRETISVDCSNGISSQSLTMDVIFLLDTSPQTCVDLFIPDAASHIYVVCVVFLD